MRFITKKRERIAISWVVCFAMVFASFAGPFSQLDAQAATAPPITVDKQVVGSDWVDKDLGIAKVKLTVNSKDIETQVNTSLKTRIVLVLDYSTSMSNNGSTKITELRTKAKAFVDQMLAINGDVQLAMVTFNDSYSVQGFTNNATTLRTKIDNTNTVNGTNIQAGIHQGQALLNGVTADNKIMVVLSDGEPNRSYQATAARAVTPADTALNYNGTEWPSVITSFNYGSTLNANYNYDFNNQNISGRTINNHGFGTISEALIAKNAGTTIYSVGFDISSGSTADKVLKAVATSNSKNFLASADLTVAFNTIGTSIIEQAAGTGAVVTDPMGYSTDVAGGNNYKFKAIIDASHPVTHTEPAGVTSSTTYNPATDSFNWVLTTGDIKEGTYTLTYYVQLQDVNGNGVGGNVADVLTNHQAVLAYTDAAGTPKSIPFTDPTLKVEHYTVEYYFNNVLDSSKTKTQAAIAGRTPVTVVAPGFSGYDFDKTVYGNNNANTALNIIQDGANNIIKIYYTAKTGSFEVTKQVLKNNAAFDVTDTFYFGLFSGADGTGLIGNVKSVELQDESTGSVNFTGLALGTTYYAFETDANGAPITDTIGGFVHLGNYVLDGQGTCFTPCVEDLSGTATIKNQIAADTSVQFEGTKNLSGRYLTGNDVFHFAIFEGDSTTPIASGQTATVSGNSSDSIDIMFDSIKYGMNDLGTHTYIVKEIPPLDGVLNGVLFDTLPRTVTVDVSMDAQGILSATVNYPDRARELVFDNEYSATGTGTVEVTKDLKGMDLADDMFSFTITETNTDVAEPYSETVTNEGTSIPFAGINYTEAGVYHYTISENAPSDAVDGVKDGITYDDHLIYVTMTVTDNGDGTLTAVASYEGGKVFTNEYNATGTGTIEVTKDLKGMDLADDMFSFTITETNTDVAEPYSETVTNEGTGIPFAGIDYTAAGVYHYTISEKIPADAVDGVKDGITYDDHLIYVTMTVTDNEDGTLTAVASYDGGQVFTNEYNATGSGTIEVTKELAGKDLKDGMFSFTITETNTDMAEPYSETETNEGASIPFGSIEYTAPGVYQYVISENIPDDAVNGIKDGITYDDHLIYVTMTVTDNGDGTLTAKASYDGGQVFTNEYTTKSVTWTPDVTKELTGKDINDYADGTFEFEINQVMNTETSIAPYTETAGNEGNNIPFDAIEYTEAGTYTYNISEVKGTVPGITYDENTIVVTVVVSDDGQGNLVAEATYDGGQVFTNEYTAKSVTWTPEVTKELIGKDINDYENGTFAFNIVPVANTETSVAQIAEPVGNVGNSIPFESIVFSEPGTYTYNISEVEGTVPGITYDKNTIVVTVEVTDDGQGNLVAKATYEGGQVFTNTYTGPGSITVTKNVVVLTEDPDITVNYTFYAALFENQEGTMVRVSDVKALQVVNSQSTSVVFDGLDLNKTYNVFETDADGNIIQTESDGTIVTPIIPDWTNISYENAVVTLSTSNLEGVSTITNVFNPQDFPLLGSITVKKTVTVNDKPFASNRTFYVALFADKGLTDMVSEVKPLKMNGNASTTTEFLTDIDGNPLEAGTTYYIAETDKNGVPLTGTVEQLGFEIAIDNPTVVITEEGTTVNIINKFTSEEFPLTGDNSNMSLWLFLAMLGVAGAIAPFAFRKKEETND